MASLLFLMASDGKNLELASQISVLAEGEGHHVSFVSLCDQDFPLFTPLKESQTPSVEGLHRLIERMEKADAWWVFAPEYNGSMPPVLNNTIAWLSREGDDFRRLFRYKRVALASHSGGGGHHCIMAMREQFSFIGCNVLGRNIVVNKSRPYNPETAKDMLSALTEGLE
ncbi:MAG: NAD(P)H-dependent oxidoreductase [Candidatus Poseidonia sp.]|nr:NAD(P)H-dependent oxidoreductase [Poseidonia sp.]